MLFFVDDYNEGPLTRTNLFNNVVVLINDCNIQKGSKVCCWEENLRQKNHHMIKCWFNFTTVEDSLLLLC